MRTAQLTARYCKFNGDYFRRIIPNNMEKEITFDGAVKIKFNLINSQQKYEFPIPNIRTNATSITIMFFKDIEIKVGDRFEFNGGMYYVEDFNVSYFFSTKNQIIKQTFATLK